MASVGVEGSAATATPRSCSSRTPARRRQALQGQAWSSLPSMGSSFSLEKRLLWLTVNTVHLSVVERC